MGKNLNAIRRALKRFKKSSQYRAKFSYARLFNSAPELNEHSVLFHSFNGTNFGGNPFYLLKELEANPRFTSTETFVGVNESKVEATKALLAQHGLNNTKVVAVHSQEYLHALVTSKFLINNSTFPTYFIKRSGQIYLNTWHGTPLKTMGRNIANEPHTIGNTQRNFLMADQLLYPNEYSFDHFRNDYMLAPYYSGKYVMAGYPCNSVFYDEDLKDLIREKLDIKDKKVVVYMPTWRQTKKNGHRGKHYHMLQFILMTLDENVDDDVVIYAKPHYYDAKRRINFKSFKKVKPFPDNLESYELLSIADLLVTDYSSVMFDFLNADKEILLFPYDQTEYFDSRGSYITLDDLPFARTYDVYDLCDRINSASRTGFNSASYLDAKAMFCPYDDKDAPRIINDLLFADNENEVKIVPGSLYHNNKPNALIFAGALTKNGLTTSLLGLLDEVDPNEANYLLTFLSGKGASAIDVINNFDSRIGYFPMQGEQVMSYSEAIARFLFYRFNIQIPWVENRINALFSREASRLFPGMKFSQAIHFTGYERNWVHLVLSLDCSNRIMYVHNDMVQERSTRSNYHLPSIERAYREFDKIAVVRESLKSVTAEGFGIDPDKIFVVHNVNRIEAIKQQAHQAISFDQQTNSNIPVEELRSLLEDKSITKFINVGRFSPEKGHKRLIGAFCRFAEDNPNSALVIIGGHGVDYKDVLAMVEDNCDKRIAVIKNLSNPFSILACCDAFILSSFYEGLPMSVMEALILNIPVISTEIEGPKEFLEAGYGRIVPDSEDGLYEGMCEFSETGLKCLEDFDAEKFNERAIKEFYKIADFQASPE